MEEVEQAVQVALALLGLEEQEEVECSFHNLAVSEEILTDGLLEVEVLLPEQQVVLEVLEEEEWEEQTLHHLKAEPLILEEVEEETREQRAMVGMEVRE